MERIHPQARGWRRQIRAMIREIQILRCQILVPLLLLKLGNQTEGIFVVIFFPSSITVSVYGISPLNSLFFLSWFSLLHFFISFFKLLALYFFLFYSVFSVSLFYLNKFFFVFCLFFFVLSVIVLFYFILFMYVCLFPSVILCFMPIFFY